MQTGHLTLTRLRELYRTCKARCNMAIASAYRRQEPSGAVASVLAKFQWARGAGERSGRALPCGYDTDPYSHATRPCQWYPAPLWTREGGLRYRKGGRHRIAIRLQRELHLLGVIEDPHGGVAFAVATHIRYAGPRRCGSPSSNCPMCLPGIALSSRSA